MRTSIFLPADGALSIDGIEIAFSFVVFVIRHILVSSEIVVYVGTIVVGLIRLIATKVGLPTMPGANGGGTSAKHIRASVDAWNERGVEGFLEYVAPGIEWRMPAGFPQGDRWRGRDELRRELHDQFSDLFTPGTV